MTSFVTESLFNSRPYEYAHSQKRAQEVQSCQSTPYRQFRSLFGMQTSGVHNATSALIHTGPSPPPPSQPLPRNETAADYPSIGFVHSAFVENHDGRGNGFFSPRKSDCELIRCGVVNERDAQRGFRLFDGILMGVKDVSSEELFLERMRIAYSIYDAYVGGHVNRSPLDVAKALVRALSACLTNYFSTQSMLRTNRPFIAKVLNLDSNDMFCTHSDFVQSFLFTSASAEDDLIISLAERVYAENDFDVCNGDYSDGGGRQVPPGHNGGGPLSNPTADRVFDVISRIAERNVVGGSQPSFATRKDFTSTSSATGNLYGNNATPTRTTGDSATAMLIVVTDFEALHNYVAYVMYLTPPQLSRRYNLNFDCLRRPGGTAYDANGDCCRERDSRKRKRDTAKAAIRTVIERRRREKIDSMRDRSAACEAVLRERAVQMLERNHDLLCHLLLMLFDKCLSSLLDRGFENLNARRGYAVASAKEIGSATVYTGIIDTVGDVSTVLEGCTFDGLVSAANRNEDVGGGGMGDENHQENQHRLHFSLPIHTIVSQETTNPRPDRTVGTASDDNDVVV